MRKVYTEISILAERNSDVKQRVEDYNCGLENTIEKFFKHGINIKVLPEDFNVGINTQITLLVMSGVDNAVTHSQNFDFEEVWTDFVDKVL